MTGRDHDSAAPESEHSPRSNPTATDRFVTAMGTGGRWIHQHVRETRQWAKQQPPRQIGAIALAGVAALAALWFALWLVTTVVSSLWRALTGGGIATPEPPARESPPRWARVFDEVTLWDRVWGGVEGFAHQHAVSAAMPGWLLLTTWGAIGAGLVLGAWWSYRWPLCTLACWGWLAATAWVVWTTTPGGSPVPAVLTAALGVLVTAWPWSTLPVGLFGLLTAVPLT